MEQQQLVWGLPNPIGEATVFVMGVRGSNVRLAVHDSRGEHPPRNYAVGDTVEFGAAPWRVAEIRRMPGNEELASPPGTHAGAVVAVLARI